jgi:hypothetical protein
MESIGWIPYYLKTEHDGTKYVCIVMRQTQKRREKTPTNQILFFLKDAFMKRNRHTRKRSKTSVSRSSGPRVMLSPKSKDFLKKLYRQIQSVTHDSHECVIENVEHRPLPDYILKELHFSLDILKIAKRTSFRIAQRRIFIECVFPEDTEFKDAVFEDVVRKIYTWLSVAELYAPAHCSNTLNIHLYMSPEEKRLPTMPKSPILINHANTAFTTSCSPTTEINIFRKEEWFKVFIHETFHSLGLDFSQMDTAKSNAHICSIFRVKSDVRLYEVFCEMWAEIVRILFFLLEKRTSLEDLPREFLNCIRYEKMFSVFQCVKVLAFFDLKYEDLFKEGAASTKYKESTQVLSYYILKSISMVFVNDFIEWCIDHNTKTLDFEKTEENVDRFCDFFESHCRLPKYLEYVEMSENVGKPSSDFIKNTLRMSVYG